MKTFKTSAVLATAFVGLFVGSANAQETVEATVPFPFVVGGEEFPAGLYEITNDDGFLAIQGMDNDSAIFEGTRHAHGTDPAGKQPALVFKRYENEYLLTEVWESSIEGLALPVPVVVPPRSHGQPMTTVEPPTFVLVPKRK